MHIICRLFFWFGLIGLALTLIWGCSGQMHNILPVAILGSGVVLALAYASARIVPASMAADPIAAAKRRRSSGMAYSIILMIVLAPLGLVTMEEGRQQVGHAQMDVRSAQRRMADGYGSPSDLGYARDDVARAEWAPFVGYFTLAAAGLAFIGLILSATRKVPQPQMAQGYGHPSIQQGYGHPQMQQAYGYGQAPMPQGYDQGGLPWNGGGQAG